MRQASFFPTLRFLGKFIVAIATATAASGVATQAIAAKQAEIVIDANTGKTLHASSADASRYPASLTKMMTLYLVFEAMHAGKLNKNTQVRFSAQAATKPPTKIGVRAGGSVTVETIIYSLVTKSANDAAAAIAEHLGGSEAGFARMMTNKARRLGMSSTVFRNASGLPDPSQTTTARDMAKLGLALREHYPQYYSYFATRSFTFGKSRMGNHNKLLGRVEGVDGIKTGYTRASGFNLVSSVRRDGRSIVAVVMGGSSGGSRDARMASLIREYMPKASTRDGGPLIAKRVVEPGAGGGAVLAALVQLPKKALAKPDPRPAETVGKVMAAAAPAPVARPEAPVEGEGDIDPVSTASTDMGGWVVQVASSPSQREAESVLAATRSQAGSILSGVSAFTVPFEKGGTTYHRVRYGAFATKTAAWNTCAALKKKKIECYAVQQ